MVRRASTPRFVGRETELEGLRQAFARASAGEPTLILIVGEAGVGKSRLVAEFATGLPANIILGACARIGEDGPPYGPFLPLIRTTGSLPRDTTALPAALVGPTARAWLFQSVVDRIEIEARREPIIAVVEDLQWSDRASRDLLDFVVRCMPPSRLLVLATVRSDELRRGHPVLGFLGELGRHERVERLDLAGLDQDAASELLRSLFGPDEPAHVLDAISRRAEGNPYFLEELAAASRRGERLPSSIRDVVDAQLADLPRDAAEIVAAVAVAGRAVEERRLAALAGRPASDAASLAEIAVERRILEHEASTDAYRFRHGLIGEVVYDSLLPAHRRALHLAAAAEMASADRPIDAETAAELAHHFARGGSHGDGLRASVRAAEAAERVFAYPDASRQWARAREQLDALSTEERPSDIDRRWLLERNATALARAGDPDRAVELERTLLDELSADGDRLAIAASRSRLAVWQWDAGEQTDVLAISAQAVAELDGLPLDRTHATVLAAHARLLMLESRLAEAALVANRAIEAATAEASDLAAGARITRGVSLAGLGRTEGLAELRRGLDLARAGGQADEIARGLLNLDYAYWSAGRLREALEVSRAGVAEIRRLGLQSAFGDTLIGNAGEKLFLLGEWAEAERLFGEASVHQSFGVSGIELRMSVAELAIGRGRFSEARDLLREARAIAPDVPRGTTTVRLGLVEAELAVWDGRWDDGLASVTSALEALADEDRATFAPRLAAIGLRILAEVAAIARARHDSSVVAACLDQAAPLRRIVAELGDSAARTQGGEDDDAFGAALRASVLLAEGEASRLTGAPDVDAWSAAGQAFAAMQSPYPEAYATFREVEARLADRQPRAIAAGRLAEAILVARRLGAHPLLAEMEALASRARLKARSSGQGPPIAGARPAHSLTGREIEVVALVAAGRTNRQIADALFITEKTAGLHVSNILGKLAVANRVQAAAAARRLGLLGPDGQEPEAT